MNITTDQYYQYGNDIMNKYLKSYYKDKEDVIHEGIKRALKTLKKYDAKKNIFVYNSMLSGMRNYCQKIQRYNSIIPNKKLPISVNNIQYSDSQ